jgi:hypothetical protein
MSKTLSVTQQSAKARRLVGAFVAAALVAAAPLWSAAPAQSGFQSQVEDELKAPKQSAPSAMTNTSRGNEIIVYSRFADGKLEESTRVATGGSGSDRALTSLGSVQLVGERFLLAVNPGDSTISVFRLRSSTDDTRLPALIGKWPSGGIYPVSIATRDGLVYVQRGTGPRH